MNKSEKITNITTLDDFMNNPGVILIGKQKTDEDLFADFVKSQEGKYITKEGDMYIVSRVIKGERREFGKFARYAYALEYERKLIMNGWNDLFNPKTASYGRFIRKSEGKYYIIREIDGEKFSHGPFENLMDAILKREELIDDNWGSEAELNFNKEGRFGKYISYLEGTFKIQKVMNGRLVNFGSFDNIANATLARDILLENNWDDSKIPEDLYSWRNFTRYHPITHAWEIYNMIGHDLVYFGIFKTVDFAKKALKILIKNNWDSSYVPLEYYHEDSNIRTFKRPNGKNFYSVLRRRNDGFDTFASFDNKGEATDYRDNLVLNNWVVDVPEEEAIPFEPHLYERGDQILVKKDGITYGVFDRICDAAQFRLECIRNKWWMDDFTDRT